MKSIKSSTPLLTLRGWNNSSTPRSNAIPAGCTCDWHFSAAHLKTDILLVDEVLAVGDKSFQENVWGKMDELSQGGRTIIFVGYNLPVVENL